MLSSDFLHKDHEGGVEQSMSIILRIYIIIQWT